MQTQRSGHQLYRICSITETDVRNSRRICAFEAAPDHISCWHAGMADLQRQASHPYAVGVPGVQQPGLSSRPWCSRCKSAFKILNSSNRGARCRGRNSKFTEY